MKKITEDEHKARIQRCSETARKLLKLMAEDFDTIALGDTDAHEETHHALAKKSLKFMLDENVNWIDTELIFQIALQAISAPAEIAKHSMKNSWDRVISGLFGKHVSKLTVSEVDQALKKGDDIYAKEEAVEKVPETPVETLPEVPSTVV